MSAEWLDAFPRTWDAVQEAQLRETSVPGKPRLVVYYPGASRVGGSDGVWLRITPHGGSTWTGVFSSDNLPGRLNLVAAWPDPGTVFVAAGGPPYLVDSRNPDSWSRLDRSTVRRFEPVGDKALLLDDDVLSAYDADGLAWESDHLGPSVWLGVLDEEVHLRSGDLLHRVSVRHGRTVTEPASW